MVFGKIRNQESLLSSCGLSSSEIQPLTALAEEALGASSHDHLLGIEGQASALYYEFYRRLFKEDLGFRKRTRRPPRDPVNSLLSFGYTLLGYSAQSAVYLVGLDPFGGFLHSTHYSRPSLALDLAEEFRPMIDGLVLQVVNSCRYQLQDFRSSEENPSAVLLTDSARKRYLEDFEGVMNRAIKYPGQGKPVTVRRALELQARQVANIVLGKREKYNPIKLSFTTG
jgi:CRISPR-associated protein Cas1